MDQFNYSVLWLIVGIVMTFSYGTICASFFLIASDRKSNALKLSVWCYVSQLFLGIAFIVQYFRNSPDDCHVSYCNAYNK